MNRWDFLVVNCGYVTLVVSHDFRSLFVGQSGGLRWSERLDCLFRFVEKQGSTVERQL